MKFAACAWFGGDWFENMEAAAKHGFSALEQLSWYTLDQDKAVETMKRLNMKSTAIVIQSKDPEKLDIIGWDHGMVWEDSRPAFVSCFRESAEAAVKMGVPNIIATTGNARKDISHEAQLEIASDTLRELVPIAEDHGLTIVLEPLNVIKDHVGFSLSTSADAFRIVDEVGSPNLKVLYDIYHQQITEGNLIPTITANIDKIGHFHIADNPGRCQPGTGEINYKNVFAAIKKTGYDRYLAFECGKTKDVDELCRDMHELIDEFED